MAPIPSSTGTIRTAQTATFDAGGTAVTFAFDAGTDADRFLIVSVTWHGGNAHTVADGAVTYNGVAATVFGAQTTSSNCRKKSWGLIAPATGSNTVSVDPSTGVGSSAAIIEVYCYSAVDQTTPYDGYNTATGASASSSLTITGAVGDYLWSSHGAQSNGVTGGTTTNFTERTEAFVDSGTADIAVVGGDAAGAASIATSVSWNIPPNWNAHGVNLNANGSSAAITGTLATGTKTQADVKAGGTTIIVTLSGDTWVAAGATFDAQRQAIINGLDAASSPSTGWNTLVRDALAVTTVVRTSATVVTITLPAIPTYAITADEVITVTIPASALTLAAEVVATPTITIHEGAVLSAYSGTTNGSGVLTVNLTSDQASVRVLTTALVNGAVVARTTTLPS